MRKLDVFVGQIAEQRNGNNNVELEGHNAFKFFPFGIAHIIHKIRRVDGSWHIAMARQMHVFFCTVEYFSLENKMLIAKAYRMLYEVECGLRSPMRKMEVHVFEYLKECLMDAIIAICLPYSKSKCNSIKYHSPYHWGDTRVQLGCSPNERSLEKKLAETQKRNYTFTNKKDNVEVTLPMLCDLM
jgi:hypothetical protein